MYSKYGMFFATFHHILFWKVRSWSGKFWWSGPEGPQFARSVGTLYYCASLFSTSVIMLTFSLLHCNFCLIAACPIIHVQLFL